MSGYSSPREKGWAALLALFASWKLLLLIAVSVSPGPGYDTSTHILLNHGTYNPASWSACVIDHVVLRLTRWDGIYFATSASRGHVNEQEWAFSWALARATSAISSVLFASSSFDPVVKTALTGIILSTLSHLLSVVILYQLAFTILPNRRLAFVSAALHVVTPAGVFLSAPSAESSFALFNFLGMLFYAKAARSPEPSSHVLTLSAGASFGLACMMRSNGLLSGIVFAWDSLSALPDLPTHLTNGSKLRSLIITIVAGVLVGIGFVLPQVVAYLQFCTGDQNRPWCTKLPPSIYSFVQDHYWNVGFLRYWTLSNLPLFLLATPMCLVTAITAKAALFDAAGTFPVGLRKNADSITHRLVSRFALPQLVLVIMTATSFHVQIISRISSGYPIWYLILAAQICGNKADSVPAKSALGPANIVKGMTMYALVQGGLYAAFLPPA